MKNLISLSKWTSRLRWTSPWPKCLATVIHILIGFRTSVASRASLSVRWLSSSASGTTTILTTSWPQSSIDLKICTNVMKMRLSSPASVVGSRTTYVTRYPLASSVVAIVAKSVALSSAAKNLKKKPTSLRWFKREDILMPQSNCFCQKSSGYCSKKKPSLSSSISMRTRRSIRRTKTVAKRRVVASACVQAKST